MGGDDLEDESLFVEQIVDGSGSGSGDEDDGDEDKEPAKKRSRRQLSPEEILIETGRGLAELDPTEQATFLNTAMRHFALKEKSKNDTKDLRENGGGSNEDILQAQWLLKKKSTDGCNMMEEIRNVVSLKKLKHWRGSSPCVVCRVAISYS
jgi:hypothetical protein